MKYLQQWRERLEQRKADGLYREYPQLESAQGAQVNTASGLKKNFASNDYLNVAAHPQLIEAFQQASKKYGVGAGASHLVCGHSDAHESLCQRLAKFTGRDAAIVFSTGYMANLGVLSALLGKQSAIFQDKLNHASLIDGALLSGARFQRYHHCDVEHLKLRLEQSRIKNIEDKLIATDSVFSMDGDIAPLHELVEVAKQFEACLMIDDAHGFGVLGKSGAGVCEQFDLSQNDVPIYMGTLSKAIGCAGAFVAGPQALIDMLKQFSRSYIYTTAMSPSIAVAAQKSLDLLAEESWRREQLQNNIAYFKSLYESLALPFMSSDTAIQPLVLGSNEAVVQLKNKLDEHGFMVGAIRLPTVPKGSERLRITLNAEHSKDDIDELLSVIDKNRQQFIAQNNKEGSSV